MTVSTTTSRIGYSGNSVTTVFAVPFRFLENTDLIVTLVDASLNQYVKVLDTDYTVTGAGDDAGGSITMVVAPATGQQLIIVREVPLTQETDYISGDPFPAETHERALDKLTMIAQRLDTLIDRSIKISDADLVVTSTTLPAPSPGSSLIWNPTGTALVNGVPVEGTLAISPYMEVVLGSADAAEARTNLQVAAESATVLLTGAQTIAGIKTFSSSPVVPTSTLATQAVNKGQIDAIVRGGVRQTVISGPVNSSGVAAFGGSTGSTTVTATGTLIASAANGFGASGAVDLVGSITNPSWTGLSTGGTMYLYLTVNTDGTCTTGSTTLAPVYQQGGTYSTTSGQFTFNIGEMVGKVGDGSAANQAYRVYVGEVTVSGGVVSAIVWYALRGEAVVETGTLAVSTAYALNHYIGSVPRRVTMAIVNVTTELSWVPGDEVQIQPNYNDGSASRTFGMGAQRLAARIVTGPQILIVPNASAATLGPITMANWKFRLYLGRGW